MVFQGPRLVALPIKEVEGVAKARLSCGSHWPVGNWRAPATRRKKITRVTLDEMKARLSHKVW